MTTPMKRTRAENTGSSAKSTPSRGPARTGQRHVAQPIGKPDPSVSSKSGGGSSAKSTPSRGPARTGQRHVAKSTISTAKPAIGLDGRNLSKKTNRK